MGRYWSILCRSSPAVHRDHRTRHPAGCQSPAERAMVAGDVRGLRHHAQRVRRLILWAYAGSDSIGELPRREVLRAHNPETVERLDAIFLVIVVLELLVIRVDEPFNRRGASVFASHTVLLGIELVWFRVR